MQDGVVRSVPCVQTVFGRPPEGLGDDSFYVAHPAFVTGPRLWGFRGRHMERQSSRGWARRTDTGGCWGGRQRRRATCVFAGAEILLARPVPLGYPHLHDARTMLHRDHTGEARVIVLEKQALRGVGQH